MTSPAVSVLIAVYNGERYLAETLDSILGQSLQDFEIVVVDDGSTDETPSILSRYERSASIRVVKAAHAGIAAALNLGLQAVAGHYVARIDADDVMVPERLERQQDFMDRNPDLGGAASFYWIIDDRGDVKGFNDPDITDVDALNRYLAVGGRVFFPSPTMIFRRHLLLEVGGYDTEFVNCEDIDLFMRLIASGHPIVFQPERLTKFRFHGASQSAGNARIQYHFNELIFSNYVKRCAGQPVETVLQYRQKWEARPLILRLPAEMRINSSMCHRRAQMAGLSGSATTKVVWLACAAALDPRRSYFKLRRMLSGRRTTGNH